ncbi:MAG: hypothetical protein ACREOE_06720, partial [Gemmatimonadales bacterium]
MTAGSDPILLLHDGTLSLTCTPDAAPLIAGWMPVGLRTSATAGAADIAVRIGTNAVRSEGAATLQLLDVVAWVEGDA